MFGRPHAKRRWILRVEELEARLVLASTSGAYIVALDPKADQFGDQVLTLQAYDGTDRLAFGILDSGASAIAFSAQDQDGFTAKGLPIPIKTSGGAMVEGIGGTVVGDVSEPGTILADGLHAAKLSFDKFGQMQLDADFTSAMSAPNVQALVGTDSGSGTLPTITGTPILNGYGGGAAWVVFQGVKFDFSPLLPGFMVTLPDLRFVAAGSLLTPAPGSTPPITVGLQTFGDVGQDGDGITQAPLTVQPDVHVDLGTTTAGGKFLFDTGAQMTVISPALAASLKLDLDNPTTSITAQGLAGTTQIPGYTVDDLILPSDFGPLDFQNVTVFVADVAGGLDGILGMNLFNTASQMLYSYGGNPSASFTFELNPKSHGPSVDEQTAATLQKLNVPFAGTLQKAGLPSFVIDSGGASGLVYQDLNMNGVQDRSEPAMPGVTVYVDTNGNGKLDGGEPQATTGEDGTYTFAALVPGPHTVRVVVPQGMVCVSPAAGKLTVRVAKGATSTGWDFGLAPQANDQPTAYINGLYATLLDRAPDPVGQTTFQAAIQSGVPARTVVATILDSPERYRLQVDRYYTTYLARPADPVGEAYWTNALNSGATAMDVQRGFLTSGEYQRAHTADDAFLEGLYQDVLGRASDAAGKAYWLAVLKTGQDRGFVAKSFLNSTEYYRRGVDQFYQDYLGRAADAFGEQYWIAVLQSGLGTWDSVAAAFLASQEYQDHQMARMGAHTASL